MKEEREESDGEEMEQESGDSDKSSSSCDSSDTDTDDSSDMDIGECERRRAECIQTLAETERQIKQLTEQLYRERITQVETKLNEVKMGRAAEYLVPLEELQENHSIRIEVAGILRQYKLANIRNNFEAEEQAANQNLHSEKTLAMDFLKDDIEEKIRMLEEDRNSVDITADLWAYERSRNRRMWSQPSHLPEDSDSLVRRKPTVVSGPYIVYMLQDADILEDWAVIKKAVTVCKRKTDWSDGISSKKETFRPKYQKDLKFQKDSKYPKERKLHFPVKPGQKLKLW
ncbi:breast cancer metastasis-suppressor 1-like protein-A isoform X2 [Macrosteles quadrilineatus]|uniref:breast cancer metastasis-suppressor 1-like protein-A isoform X2 n=1 Tax=Macrosteles quadrilineatus TaxID=74068 RepID=UPI0023E32B78|nr:breast cancer metastasis-suppressor 1-like protein-A isoform X2 [Macrosteles quadrilineatus]